MRKYLIGWPGIGLLCAALGSAAIAQDRTKPEAATIWPTLTTDTSSSAIQARERLRDPEQRKAVRANIRQSIEQDHASLDEVLPLGPTTRSKLFELLTDLRMEDTDRYANEPRMRTGPIYSSWEALQAAEERERFAANDLQRSAGLATRDRQRIRDVLGEARFQQYIEYEGTRRESAQVAYFDRQLPAENKLDASQRERMMRLLKELRQQRDDARQLAGARARAESTRRSYTNSATERDPNLEGLRRSERRLEEAAADGKQLLAQVAAILTPPQLAVYETNEATRLAQELAMAKRVRKRAGVDIETPPVLPPDPAAVVTPRTPLAGRVQLDVKIKVNESAITQRSLLADNGAVVTFEFPALTIEAVPILFDDGWRELTLKFYEPDGKGGRRRINANPQGVGIMVGVDPVQKLDAVVRWPSRGHAIIGNFTLSSANALRY
jgi:hypothetical protein